VYYPKTLALFVERPEDVVPTPLAIKLKDYLGSSGKPPAIEPKRLAHMEACYFCFSEGVGQKLLVCSTYMFVYLGAWSELSARRLQVNVKWQDIARQSARKGTGLVSSSPTMAL
jgi:hypothetical protein